MTENKGIDITKAWNELVFESLEFVVTPELNEQCLYGEEDYHPRYLEKDDTRRPLVHPGLLLNMSNITRSPSFKPPQGIAAVHSGDEVEFVNPARVGDKIIVTWKTGEVYTKRERLFGTVDALVATADGSEILRRKIIGLLVSRDF